MTAKSRFRSSRRNHLPAFWFDALLSHHVLYYFSIRNVSDWVRHVTGLVSSSRVDPCQLSWTLSHPPSHPFDIWARPFFYCGLYFRRLTWWCITSSVPDLDRSTTWQDHRNKPKNDVHVDHKLVVYLLKNSWQKSVVEEYRFLNIVNQTCLLFISTTFFTSSANCIVLCIYSPTQDHKEW